MRFMIKNNQKVFNRMHVAMDAMILIVAYALAYFIKFYILNADTIGIGVLPPRDYFLVLFFLVPGYLFLYFFCNVYGPKRTIKQKNELFCIVKANTFGMGFYIIILYLFVREIHYSREMMALFYVINIFLTAASRLVLRKILRTIRKKGYNIKHVLVVGYSRAAEAYIDRLQWNPQWGYSVVGILDNHMSKGSLYKGVKVLGGIEGLNEILQANDLDEIAVALSLRDYEHLEEIVNMCEKSGVHTKFVPDYNSLIPSRPYTEDMMGLPVINIRYVPLSNAGNAFLKRMMDVVGSVFGIIITSPILLVIALAIKLTSPGPIIFKQERVGLHNKSFYMYKFRSMELQSEEDEKRAWTVKNDPRVTPVGKFIRRTSIDELPQLFNILKGDMSLVGPRPERPLFVEKFKEEIPRYMIKHQIRPGLTGWAQVNGYRGDTSILKRIEYDLYYIENWTVGLDVKIILLTFITGFVNKNAY